MSNSTRITLPADGEAAVVEVSAVAALLDKNGWKAAAFIAVSVKPGEGNGRKPATSGRLSTVAFAKALDAKGWSKTIISRHYNAWEAAANDGLVPHAIDLEYGERIEVPTDGWSVYYPPILDSQHSDAEAIQAQATADGTGASKAVDIAKNPAAMAAAIKASPKVAEAAAQALVDSGDVTRLSKATAAAARNRQVERNRERLSEGLGKGRSVLDPKPSLGDPMLAAFLKTDGLVIALRALVTTFPAEWAALSDEVRRDEDYVAVCEETLDKLEIAIANIRTMIAGGITDGDLERLLSGGGE